MSERPKANGENEAQFSSEAALERRAKQAVESVGYQVESITFIPEGRSHHNFAVISRDNPSMIARFEKLQAVDSPDGIRRDFHFNGPLSLARERNLIDLVRDKAGLPTPIIYGSYSSELGNFLMVEKLPGVYWSDFMKGNSYSLEAYLKSLKFLGRDLARVHQVHFDSYGDAMGRNTVYPGTIKNFPQRLQMITELRLQRAQYSGALQDKQLEQVTNYVHAELDALEKIMKSSDLQPVLCLTDIHPMNFFVDDQGKPSGYFDLESCQAAHPALEFNVLRTTLLNYFEDVSEKAEGAFLNGYRENGGEYDPQDPVNKRIEQILGVGYLIAAITTYHNASDGLRDTWSEQFKQILFEVLKEASVDYSAISDVYRSKTGQPRYPLK